MKLPSLRIRNLETPYPVIQAGMGVRIGNCTLASETINLGGYGTIASVGLGDYEKSKTDFIEQSNTHLIKELRKARELSNNKKPLGINVMVALSNYEEIVRTAVAEKVDFIISGAGLPLQLPAYVGDADIALMPIVSSGRALNIIIKTWKRKFNRAPDAIVIESPFCGGHLGFSMEQLNDGKDYSLKKLYDECKVVADKHELKVPIIAAGEVASREDIEEVLKMGYNGVQIGTKFIATDESGINRASKEVFVNASNDDVMVIMSPVGLPGRVLKTPLVERILKGGREDFACPYRCLRTCNPRKVQFCIAKALIATCEGDYENGLYMSGSNVDALDKITPLKEFFDTLKD